ncbi:hypothetical protein ACHMWN_08680 [Pedobacter sp. UC225_61]|uniref:hypothetical protein n=1 Tax=Pedobacter sp. UC225_61 TaxID=3374623 RepID=UPI0037B7D9BA
MGWFKWKKELSPQGDAVAKRAAERILAFQQKLADRLNAVCEKWNRKTLLMVLLALGVAFGAYCLWLVTGLFR